MPKQHLFVRILNIINYLAPPSEMSYSHAEILARIKSELSPEQVQQAAATVERLHKELPDHEHLQNNHVMLLMGGGKDSTWMTAYTRLVQLMLEERHGNTFILRAATGRHPGMQMSVMQNIDRTYKALGMYDDPSVETIMIHNSGIVPFDPKMPLPDDVVQLNRADVLMNAHRFAADARRTFCDSCNLRLSNWIGLAAAFNGGADILVTGDSLTEQSDYARWISKLAHKLGVKVSDFKKLPQFTRMMRSLDGIGRTHTSMIHGDDAEAHKDRRVHNDFPKETKLFTIYSDTAYSAREHLSFLKDFIGFDFNTLMSSFTETDCGNPALMAHLHGLAAQHLFHARYEDGVQEYVAYGIRMMGKKDFPEELVELMRERYQDDAAIQDMRGKVERYAWETYRLTPEQMTAMVYASFAGNGTNLHVFLEREHPDLLSNETAIRQLLSGNTTAEHGEAAALAGQLERMSGLTLEQLQRNYKSTLVRNPLSEAQEADTLKEKLLVMGIGDPLQETIVSRINLQGKPKERIISGR
ncbi:MAG: PqqD family protein [Alphaproteobacteria bacterium]